MPSITSCEQAWLLHQKSDMLVAPSRVEDALRDMGAHISNRLMLANPIVLAVMNGGTVFAGRLMKYLTMPMEYDYVHATRYQTDGVGTVVRWFAQPPTAVQGRTVLVLDDILDHGHTLAAIRDKVLGMGATAFYSAVLVEKVLGTEKPIKADFVGLTVPDRWVFGCGMDISGYWRNLPEIRAVRR